MKLRLGVVGCGDIAGYVALLSRLVPQLGLAACCDLNLERARAFARRHRIPAVFDDYAALLAKAAIDAIYLAVPHHLHYEMVAAAVRAGKPVLVEKPLTRTLVEGVQLVELVARSGVPVGVNYQYRYDSGCHALARAVQSGALGVIHSGRINIPWHREAAYFDGAPWHKSLAQAGGGALITQGSHFLDVALWALGEGPRSAMGYTASPGFAVEVETLAQAIIDTESGVLLQISSSMVAASEQAVSIELYGERGAAIYRDRPFPQVKFSGLRLKKQPLPVWGVHALHRSLIAFSDWILKGRPYLIPAAETLPVLAAVDAVYRSAASGTRCQVAYPDPESDKSARNLVFANKQVSSPDN